MACTTVSLFIVLTSVVIARFVVDRAEKNHRRQRAQAIRIELPRRSR
jgi:hypothetical protein